MQGPMPIPMMDRLRYIGYGVIGGLIAGAFLGWIFHAWVGFVVKFFFVLVFLVIFLLALNFWRKVTTKPVKVADQTVTDADWIEIESRSRTRR